MTGTLIIDGNNLTVLFEYSGTIETIGNILLDLSHELFDRGQFIQPDPAHPLTWEQLSNEQRLDMIDRYISANAVNMAEYYYKKNAVMVAAEQAVVDTANRYTFE